MRRTTRRALFVASPILVALACGPAQEAAPPPRQPPLPRVPEPPRAERVGPAKVELLALDTDPTATGMTKDGIVRLCDAGIARARASLDEVRRLKDAPAEAVTWDATIGRFDEVSLAVKSGGDFAGLMAVAHPDEAVREAAKDCEPKMEKLDTEIWLDATLATVVKRYAARKERLEGPRARMLDFVLRDYRRNGLDLPAEKQGELRAMNEELTKLSQEFEHNLASATLSVEATPKQLEGLPASYLESHKPDASGKIKITTDYPDYFPVAQYAKDRAFALELYRKFDDRAADKNVALLDRVLAVRARKAKLLGYATWADYVLEPRMAKSPKAVATFLDGLRTHLAAKNANELAEFRAMKKKIGQDPGGPIYPSDRLYLEDLVRKEKYGLDSKVVSEYLEVGKVREGLLAVTERLFDVRYRKVEAAAWHGDVSTYEVVSAKGELLGRFYFDLHPRPGKYKHAAVFSIRDARRMLDGKRLTPISAIVCNFPRTTKDAPGLMSHQDTVTFFHEFGHVLHHLLSRSELSRFSGTSVERDFVEAPSQMLEEWAWSKEVLDLFAKHHKTGEVLPAKLHTAMTRSRGFGRGLGTARQLFLAALDQTYHTREPPFDTTKVLEEVQSAYTPFKYVEGTHFQATFGHLMGYDAGYYGYQWALAIAQDMFSRFRKAGLFDPKTAADYRAAVLEPGGSDDAGALVARFLGRETNTDAYRAYLAEKAP